MNGKQKAITLLNERVKLTKALTRIQERQGETEDKIAAMEQLISDHPELAHIYEEDLVCLRDDRKGYYFDSLEVLSREHDTVMRSVNVLDKVLGDIGINITQSGGGYDEWIASVSDDAVLSVISGVEEFNNE